MKKKIVGFGIAVLAALPLGIVTAPAASATDCDRYPCYGTCKVNREFIVVDDSGTVTVGRPFECYY